MESLLLLFVLVLAWSASMAWSIWAIRDRDSERARLRVQLETLQSDHLAREQVLLNRILAKDPSEFLTLQAGTSVTEWPKRRQLLTDKDEAGWDRERRGGN